jgi:hypothetical protein
MERVDERISIAWGGDTETVPGARSGVREVAYQLQQWVEDSRAATNRSSMFQRGKWVSSDNVYDQMRTARAAVKDDDVVANMSEVTEGLALEGVKWECDDFDTTDVFNQMAAEQNLDKIVRQIWKEEYTYSQCYLGFWWDWGTFTVRGKTSAGNKKKKTFKVWFPRAVTVLDATKIVPVGLLAFGQERFAWQATRNEIGSYNAVTLGELQDELMTRFYSGQYMVRDEDELLELTQLRIDIQRLLLLDDRYVKRHCLTRADYERFPDVRLKSIFRLLDMKQQLMEADRVSLIGAANYILLVKKGDAADPAYPEEITNLKENYQTLAKLPVIFSDHRLSVEIITPKQDFTLHKDKYETLDVRIAQRVLNTMTAPSSSGGASSKTALAMGRPVARGMENRRHMMRRFLERELSKAVVEHPDNAGQFDVVPSLTFSPPNIQLDQDAAVVNAIAQARTMNEISRESYLEYLGFDQDVEAMRRSMEKLRYDDVFETRIPFSSPGTGGGGDPLLEGPHPLEAPPAGAPPNKGKPEVPPAGKPALKDTTTPVPPVVQAPHGARGGRPPGGGKPNQNPTKPVTRPSKGGTT